MSDANHEVSVIVEDPFASQVDASWIGRIVRHVLASETTDPAELDVLVTDDATVHRLNREFADEDRPTDVLAFSLQEGEEFASPDGVARLGEVIISHDTAVRQAAEAARPVADEIAHLLVHGTLHLLGYDHAEPADEHVMRSRETQLLASFGINR